ncbi:MAG: hypothetical protein HBSAPP03_09300 [Phycisphaerae bacterium]|nr:MAG: hypothetical protein HBSAPP03_09300 [Phycisphaerae bacterium]
MNTRTLSTAAGLLLLGGTAFAQGRATTLEGSLDQPLTGQNPTAYVRMTETNGSTTYELEIKDGKTTVKVDGKKVPAKRVRERDGAVEVLNDDGSVMKTFHVGTARTPGTVTLRNAPGTVYVTPGAPTAPAVPQPPATVWTEMAEPPKTMIGIRMDDEAEGAVVLTDVIENLPAAKAGLLAGDTLVSIAGKKIEKVTDVREAIKDHNPGDKVDFVISRDGKEMTFAVVLDAWNSDTLYKGMPEDEIAKFRGALTVAGQDTSKFAEEAHRALEKALKEIQSSDAKAQFEKSWSDAMKQAMKALEQSKDSSAQWLRSFSAPSAPRAARVFTPSGQGGVYTFAAPEAGYAAATEKRLEELNQRLDELSERLDKLMKKLEKQNP